MNSHDSAKPKRALVTGASSGIGEAFARRLAAEGYAVTVVARRESKLAALVDALPGDGHRIVVADLGTGAGVTAVSEALDSEHHQLLVNNAGYSVLKPFADSTLEEQQAILNVNCAAVVSLAHHFLAQAQPGDALINVASAVAVLPTPAQPMYSASKAFLASFSECLWEEQRERGVYVMALCPGVTRTEFISTATGGESDGESLPPILVQTADEVVSEAMAALAKRNKPMIVTGWLNRLMVAVMPRMLTRFGLLKTMAVMGDPERALN
jgi:short-subunit dehydrogenase